MKKLFSILAILMMATTSWAEESTTWTDAAGVEWQKVSTPADFKTQVKANKNILLTADIDLSKLTPEKSDQLFDHEFKGKINGMYVKAQGDTLISSLRNAKVVLFEKMTDAKISNVIISKCEFNGWDEQSGQIASIATNCTFEYIGLSECTFTGDRNAWDCDRMGGLVGNATSCTFDHVSAMSSVLRTDGQYAGLLVGYATKCNFTDCSANAACGIWADGNSTLAADGNAYVGGLCGYATGSSFTKCVNLAIVSSDDDRMGGIVGYATSTSITDCLNYGPVTHNKLETFNSTYSSRLIRNATYTIGASVGGGIGSVALGLGIGANDAFYGFQLWAAVKLGVYYVCKAILMTSIVVAAVATVVVSVAVLYSLNYEPDEAGGIAGAIEGKSTISRCSNYGFVRCFDAYSGGIVGYANGSTIEACLNQGFVYGQEQLGGIVGYIKNCTVRNNLSMSTIKAENAKHMGMIEGQAEGTNTCSGNYYLDSETKDNGTSKAVTQEQLASGEVTIALNQAIKTLDSSLENVFRQNLGKNIYPTLNSKDEIVTATTSNYNLVHEVSTPEEFCSAIVNRCATIKLKNNIDLSSSLLFALYTLEFPFCGEIDGQGYAITGVNYIARELRSDSGMKLYAALFSFAKGATFKNLVIDNFHITQLDENFGSIDNISTLVGKSDGCTYSNITVRNCSILKNEDDDYLDYVGGIVSESNGDNFTDCTAESTCTFNGYSGNANTSTYVGGIASMATGSTFTQCHNASTIWADDNYEGGIVGWASGCTISKCLNTGHITAQEKVGGIVGYGKNTQVTHCVNTGVIDDDDKTREDYRSGIAGYMEGSSSVVNCLNFGSVNHADEDTSDPISHIRNKEEANADKNYYYCQYNGGHVDNVNGQDGTTWANMQSGEYALNMTDINDETWLYQYIDNVNPFVTNLPVPIPAAGKVYSNILCDGTQSYSNIYKSTSPHEGHADDLGRCTICGKRINPVAASDVHINNAESFIDLAKIVNEGTDFSGHTVYLDNDIDMAGYAFVAIGNRLDKPFKGTFDGQGHCIKNASYFGDNHAAGVFGVVAGTSVIKNLVIDSSCSFSGTGYGVAGIVGCLALPTEGDEGEIDFTMTACGNEATIIGNVNAAGLIGGVYNCETNHKVKVAIKNCYNVGTISGTEQSAALIGYMPLKAETDETNTLNIQYCFNGGSLKVGSFDTDHALIRCSAYNDNLITDHVYNLSGAGNDVKATNLSATDFIAGQLYVNLTSGNESNPWGQILDKDTYPNFKASGLSYERNMTNAWGTVVLPFDVDYSQSNGNYKLYKLSAVDGTNLNCTEFADGIIPAGTPMLVKKLCGEGIAIDAAGTQNFSMTITEQNTENASLPAGWTMTGTFINLTGKTGIYFIAQDKFWWAEEGITIAPFRAWFTCTSSSPAKTLFIKVAEDGETTAIGSVNSEQLTVNNEVGAVYNIQGQRLTAPQKGQINIVNGKKVLIK